ncbi:MAG: putative sulfate exporter family transporter [Clostridia bacterium]|nr:putative sulfate exporter family transporter [Clostridia bacterium]
MKSWGSLVPGVGLSLLIAILATLLADLLDRLLGTHLIGAAVIAMFIGMGVNAVRKPGARLTPGLKFTSKKLLKFAIILLGASLSIGVILDVGRMSLLVMVFTLLTCFGGGYFCGKALGLNWKTSSLISAGTGICGGSAIAAIAPTIDATDTDVAFAMSATFLFDMAMILLFPILGRMMGLTDEAFGLWAGTAVNDTSSVVATGYAFSEAAGDFATMVKLTRTLSIIPTVIVFALISVRLKRREALASGSTQEIRAHVSIANIFPWFILGFLGMACVKSLGLIPDGVSSAMKDVSKFLMVAALAAIGLNTSFSTMRKSGARPMLHGFIISALVVIVALAVEYVMHLMGWLTFFA